MEETAYARTAVVTGGSGYVGSAIIDTLVARGFRVFNLSRTSIQKAHVETILCDLSDKEATEHAAEIIKKQTTTVDVLVHAAAPPTTRVALEDTPPESARKEHAVAVDALRTLVETLVPIIPTDSTIVGITTASLDKEIPEKNIGAYIPAKAALRELLRSLQDQLKDQKIRVFEVAPTFLPGGLNKHLPEGVRAILARRPDGSTPTAQDIAIAIDRLIP